MEHQKKDSEILLKATAQGFSVAIHGQKEEDGSWKCSLERNEITLTDLPTHEEAVDLGELRDYEKTEFELSFDEAFRKFDQSEWFLCHPGHIHADFAEFVMQKLDQKMEDYDNEFPADTAMESFFRKNKTKEWKAKADAALAG